MQQQILEKLEEFGLSEKEAKVYLASLELGKSTAEKLSKHSGVNRSTTYVQIEELMRLGLMSTHHEGKKAYFTAESPDHLNRLIERKKKELLEKAESLSTFVPELSRIFVSVGERPVVRFFEGKQGLVTMRNEVLKTKEKTMLIASSHDHMREVFTWDELMAYSEERAKRKINPKVIYTKTGDDIPFVPPIELRRIDKDKYPFESEIYIYDNTVAIASLKDKISGVIIESDAAAKSMKTMFYLAWEAAESHAISKRNSKKSK